MQIWSYLLKKSLKEKSIFCTFETNYKIHYELITRIINSVTSTIFQIPAMVVRKVYFLTLRINPNIDMLFVQTVVSIASHKWFCISSSRYLHFTVTIQNTRTVCKICAKLTIKTPGRCHWCCSCVFIVNFEQIWNIFCCFRCSLWTSNVGWDEVTVESLINHYCNF